MSWMLTKSGRKVDLLYPKPGMICLDDIAYHLARIHRFTGATTWSVAQHSIFAAALCEADGHHSYPVLWTLLHDAHEAYTGDISTPMKSAIGFSHIEHIEMGLDRAIRAALGLEHLHTGLANGTAKKYDQLATAYERKLFMPDHPDWPKRTNLPPLTDDADEVLGIIQTFDRRPDQVELTFKRVYETVWDRLTTPPEPEPVAAAAVA